MWFGRLLADLHRGRSCLWLLPHSMLKPAGDRADRLMDEVLHELSDFVLLPSDERGTSASARPPAVLRPATTGRWSGLASVPDFDDGLPDLPTARSSEPSDPEPSALPSPAEALAGLLERLAKELGFNGDTDTVGSDPTGDVLAQLIRRGTGTAETRPLVVRAWREPVPSAAAHLLRRLVATAKEAGLPGSSTQSPRRSLHRRPADGPARSAGAGSHRRSLVVGGHKPLGYRHGRRAGTSAAGYRHGARPSARSGHPGHHYGSVWPLSRHCRRPGPSLGWRTPGKPDLGPPRRAYRVAPTEPPRSVVRRHPAPWPPPGRQTACRLERGHGRELGRQIAPSPWL